MASDATWMGKALDEARLAEEHGDIPVGAIVVIDGEIIGRGHNRRRIDNSPLAHAEVLALEDAAARLGTWRFDDAVMYVTLEPCSMCAGAIVQARLARVVFGASEPRSGAARSLYQILDDPRASHRAKVTGGVRADECAALLSRFFAALR